MILFLDTSIIIDLERKNKITLDKIYKMTKLHSDPARITFITYYEFLNGIEKKNIKNKKAALEFINNFEILQITKETANILSELKIRYNKLGVNFSLTDLLIAAQVIENQMLLITKDSDFNKIKELNKIIL